MFKKSGCVQMSKKINLILKMVIIFGLIIIILGSILVVKTEKERDDKVTILRAEIYKLRGQVITLETKNPVRARIILAPFVGYQTKELQHFFASIFKLMPF